MQKCGRSWDLKALLTFSTKGGWEGRARSLRIRLGRKTIIYLHDPTSKTSTIGLVHFRKHPWCWDKPQVTSTHLTHYGPNSREATTFPHIIFSTAFRRGYVRMTLFLETPKVSKLSRFALPGLWASITSCSNLRLGWDFKQSCRSPQELSNAMSHTICKRRDQVDSRLLMVESQIVNLTPGPSFAHNLVCRCSNGSREAILNIYTSSPFQWHQNTPMRDVLTPAIEL
jgi:hypothetical protein